MILCHLAITEKLPHFGFHEFFKLNKLKIISLKLGLAFEKSSVFGE